MGSAISPSQLHLYLETEFPVNGYSVRANQNDNTQNQPESWLAVGPVYPEDGGEGAEGHTPVSVKVMLDLRVKVSAVILRRYKLQV